MTSNRPYLIRALHEWITDNHLTPYILVDATQEGVEIPKKYIEDGKIILNISFEAVQNLQMANQLIEFDASFSGVNMEVTVPVRAVLAIYARETGRGMVFQAEEDEGTSNDLPLPPSRSARGGKPKLTIVK
jgi:stringent starvation protein B